MQRLKTGINLKKYINSLVERIIPVLFKKRLWESKAEARELVKK